MFIKGIKGIGNTITQTIQLTDILNYYLRAQLFFLHPGTDGIFHVWLCHGSLVRTISCSFVALSFILVPILCSSEDLLIRRGNECVHALFALSPADWPLKEGPSTFLHWVPDPAGGWEPSALFEVRGAQCCSRSSCPRSKGWKQSKGLCASGIYLKPVGWILCIFYEVG